jgi:hypothetical protein
MARHAALSLRSRWQCIGARTYRAMAERLGLRSHAHCWRVARRYRNRQIPMLPDDAQGLLALRDSLGLPPTQQQVLPWWMAREWRTREEIWGYILLTQEQKVQAVAEFDRRELPGRRDHPTSRPPMSSRRRIETLRSGKSNTMPSARGCGDFELRVRSSSLLTALPETMGRCRSASAPIARDALQQAV